MSNASKLVLSIRELQIGEGPMRLAQDSYKAKHVDTCVMLTQNVFLGNDWKKKLCHSLKLTGASINATQDEKSFPSEKTFEPYDDK